MPVSKGYISAHRLAKVEREIEERKKKQAKRDNKRYLGEMLHVDTKRLLLLSGQRVFDKREDVVVDNTFSQLNFSQISLI